MSLPKIMLAHMIECEKDGVLYCFGGWLTKVFRAFSVDFTNKDINWMI